jgi:hypothetical protein
MHTGAWSHENAAGFTPAPILPVRRTMSTDRQQSALRGFGRMIRDLRGESSPMPLPDPRSDLPAMEAMWAGPGSRIASITEAAAQFEALGDTPHIAWHRDAETGEIIGIGLWLDAVPAGGEVA